MTLRLILMRHAKSGWDDPTLEDHDRPLNDRGRRSATAIGNWLVANQYLPDAAISSTSQRTRETWELVRQGFSQTQAEFSKALYLASPDVMLGIIRKVSGAKTLLLLGHNPGTGYLAADLANANPDHPQFQRYPTAATTVFEFGQTSWSDIGPAQGRIINFVVPRDLI
ncbi:MAG: histidine phosphatase family protein [Marinosulfonomonas sp.]|nr:histidine phosphatase family protein [Marinosulfonomonas sp.]